MQLSSIPKQIINIIDCQIRIFLENGSTDKLIFSSRQLPEQLCAIVVERTTHLELGIRIKAPWVGGDISGGKQARAKKIFSNLTKVRMLNKTVEIISLQHYSF